MVSAKLFFLLFQVHLKNCRKEEVCHFAAISLRFLKLKQFAFQVLVGSIIVLVGSKGSAWYKFASFASDGGSSFASTINGP